MKKINLTEGDVYKNLLHLAVPVMASSLIQFTYNIIDMLWVGKIGSDAITSIGTASFFINLGYALNSIVVIGTGIKVSYNFGKKQMIKTRQYINASTLINIIISLIYSIIIISLGKKLVGIFSINDFKIEYDAYMYMVISAFGVIFTFSNIVYSRIIGSFGNNKLPFLINSIGIIVNIILDPVLIYVFNMGVLGAAIATVISNIIMFVIYFIKAFDFIKYSRKVKIKISYVLEILKLGAPMACQRIFFTIINILLAKMIAIFGAEAIAAHRIGLQIESVTYMVIGGINSAIATFTGQNFGANKYKRIKEGYHISLKIGVIYCIITGFIFVTFGRDIVKLFVYEEKTIFIAKDYLMFIAFAQVFSAIEMISNGLFTGFAKPKIPAIISIIFTGFRIPIAMILLKYYGVDGIWISISISSILKGLVSYILYVYRLKNKYNFNLD